VGVNRPPRRRSPEEGIAIALELGGADTEQAAEGVAVAGAEAGCLDQRAILKDYGGRSAEPQPFGFQLVLRPSEEVSTG
jgi:hypothetical protein